MKLPKFSRFSRLTPDNSHEFECGSGDFAPDVAVRELTEAEEARIAKLIAKGEKEPMFSWMPRLPKFPGISRFSRLTPSNSQKYERGSGDFEPDAQKYELTTADENAISKLVTRRERYNESLLGEASVIGVLAAASISLVIAGNNEVRNNRVSSEPAEVSTAELSSLDSSDAVASIRRDSARLLERIESARRRTISAGINAIGEAVLAATEALPEPEPEVDQINAAPSSGYYARRESAPRREPVPSVSESRPRREHSGSSEIEVAPERVTARVEAGARVFILNDAGVLEHVTEIPEDGSVRAEARVDTFEFDGRPYRMIFHDDDEYYVRRNDIVLPSERARVLEPVEVVDINGQSLGTLNPAVIGNITRNDLRFVAGEFRWELENRDDEIGYIPDGALHWPEYRN